jgi:chitodextrinase
MGIVKRQGVGRVGGITALGRLFVFLLLAAIAAGALPSTAAAAYSALTNPWFANWSSTTKPSNWTFAKNGTFSAGVTRVGPSSGYGALVSNKGTSSGNLADLKQSVLVTPGKCYTFAMWAATRRSPSKVQLILLWKNSAGPISQRTTTLASGENDGDYHRMLVSGLAPTKATYVEFYLRVIGSTSTYDVLWDTGSEYRGDRVVTAISGIPSGWTNAPVTFGLSAIDNDTLLSGADQGTPANVRYFKINGGGQQTYGGPRTISASDGPTRIDYWSDDGAGNSEAPPAPKSVTYYTDTQRPWTQIGDVPSSWTSAPVTFSLTAGDNLSGVAATHYELSGATTQPDTIYPLGQRNVWNEGTTTVTYWSVDNAGNVEVPKTAQIRIDSTDPNIWSSSRTPLANECGWNNTTVTVAFDATDTPSGIDSVTPTVSLSSEGASQSVLGTATDRAGRVATVSVGNINIDKERPSTIASGIPMGRVNTSVTVTLEATDGLSGAMATYYSLSGAQPQAVTAYTPSTEVTVSAEGTTTISYWSVDHAHNVEETKTAQIRISRHSPVTEMRPASPPGWIRVPFSFALVPSSSVSPVQATYYTLNGSLQPTYTLDTTVTVSDEGTTVVSYWSVDDATNREESSFATIGIDYHAPETTMSPLPSPGWVNHDVAFSLPASDSLSGVNTTYYRLNGGATHTYDTTVTVSDEGTTVVSYWSVDNAGNVEEPHSATVRIDKTPPGEIIIPPLPPGWINYPAAFMCLPLDSLSGIDISYCRIDDGPVTACGELLTISDEGNSVVNCWAIDNAGNVLATSETVGIDYHAPETTMSPLPSPGWVNHDVEFSLPASDSLSGVDTTYYRINGEATRTYDTTVTVSDEGTTVVSYWSVDNAGNVESERTSTITIDMNAPVTEIVPPAPIGWVSHDVTLTLEATDSLSGVKTTYYSLNDGDVRSYTSGEILTIPDEGVTTISYWSEDNAGNMELPNTTTIFIDKTPPATTVTPPPPSGWTSASVSFELDATDSLSDVQATCYALNGSLQPTYTPDTTVTISDEGTTVVSYWSVDDAGNIEPGNATTITVDTVAPLPSNLATTSVTTSTISLSWTAATDAVSGVSYYSVHRNGSVLATTSSTTYTDTGLDPDTTYGYYVTACDVAGNESDPSNAISVTTELNPAPITTLTVEPPSPDGNAGWYTTVPTCTLNSSPDTTIRYWWDSSAPTTYTEPVHSAQGQHTLYFFATKTGCATETTNSSPLLKVDPGASTPPSDLATTSVTTSTISLSWTAATDAVSGVSYYSVHRNGSVLATTSSTTYTDTGLDPDTTYGYYVTACDVAGNESDPSNTLDVTTKPGNHAPAASDVSSSTRKGDPVQVTLLATDEDNDPLTFSIETSPTHGSLSPISGNKVTYTPEKNFKGSDTFSFRANDGQADSNIAAVWINVTAVPIPTGTNVTVTSAQVTVTFPSVTASGVLEVTPYAPRQEGPTNFRLLPDLYFDIHPTATFSGMATIVLTVPGAYAGDITKLRVFHWTDSGWETITPVVDVNARTLTFQTATFSDFGVGEPSDSGTVVSTPASSSWSLVLASVLAIVSLVLLRPREGVV